MATSRTRSSSASTEKVHFNTDTYESERGDVEPFAAVIGGKRIVMTDPTDLPWQVLEDIDDPESFAELVIPEADREHFLTFPLSAKKLNGLMTAYQKHYGLGSQGNAGA